LVKPPSHGFTKAWQPLWRSVAEHSITHITEQFFLNCGTDRKIRISGSERNNAGGLLRPAQVEGALPQQLKRDCIVSECLYSLGCDLRLHDFPACCFRCSNAVLKKLLRKAIRSFSCSRAQSNSTLYSAKVRSPLVTGRSRT